MKRIYKIVLSCILTVNINAFRLGVLSDVHIGEGCNSPYDYDEDCYSVQTARRTVNYINANLTSDIDLIIITGDITGSGQRTQYEKAYEILSGLTVPWVPLIGNHDTWPYSKTWEHPTADGDAYFGEIFGEHIKASKFVSDYPNITAFDPVHGFNQTPQNIEITIDLGETDAVIFGGDFNTRMHALFGDKGNLG
jgi:predicted phosphodiesterase